VTYAGVAATTLNGGAMRELLTGLRSTFSQLSNAGVMRATQQCTDQRPQPATITGRISMTRISEQIHCADTTPGRRRRRVVTALASVNPSLPGTVLGSATLTRPGTHQFGRAFLYGSRSNAFASLGGTLIQTSCDRRAAIYRDKSYRAAAA